MTYTEKAGAALEEYVERVRRSVAGRSDFDVEEVVSGIREHVEAALTMRGIDRASAEDVLEVLDRLGPPDSLAEADGTQQTAEAPLVARATIWAALALATLGIMLFPTRLMPVGIAILAVALIAARAALEEPVSGTAAHLARLFWGLGVAVVELGLLLGPAVLVWTSAQTGGVLEDSLARYAGVTGPERPGRYWAVMAMVAGAVTGMWWILVAVVARTSGAALRRALGPASSMFPRRSVRVLAIAGAGLLVLSLLLGWLS